GVELPTPGAFFARPVTPSALDAARGFGYNSPRRSWAHNPGRLPRATRQMPVPVSPDPSEPRGDPVLDSLWNLLLDSWYWVLLVIERSASVAVTFHAVLHKRDPRSAAGWVGLAWLA